MRPRLRDAQSMTPPAPEEADATARAFCDMNRLSFGRNGEALAGMLRTFAAAAREAGARDMRKRAAQVVGTRGRKVGGAVDPDITASAIRALPLSVEPDRDGEKGPEG